MRGVAAHLLLAAFALSSCSAQPPTRESDTAQLTAPSSAAAATQDAATRTAPMVPGRPGRVFIFAGVGQSCEPLSPPEVSVSAAPRQGTISFKPGQETTIAASAKGTCAGAKATGTGVYYTAREDAAGTDTFTLTARLASGETMTRTFAVAIAP